MTRNLTMSMKPRQPKEKPTSLQPFHSPLISTLRSLMLAVPVPSTFKTQISEDMFLKSNSNIDGFAEILHYLFYVWDPTICDEKFKFCWPISDKKGRLEFLRAAFNVVIEMKKLHPEAPLPAMPYAFFLQAGGRKFCQTMLQFTECIIQFYLLKSGVEVESKSELVQNSDSAMDSLRGWIVESRSRKVELDAAAESAQSDVNMLEQEYAKKLQFLNTEETEKSKELHSSLVAENISPAVIPSILDPSSVDALKSVRQGVESKRALAEKLVCQMKIRLGRVEETKQQQLDCYSDVTDHPGTSQQEAHPSSTSEIEGQVSYPSRWREHLGNSTPSRSDPSSGTSGIAALMSQIPNTPPFPPTKVDSLLDLPLLQIGPIHPPDTGADMADLIKLFRGEILQLPTRAPATAGDVESGRFGHSSKRSHSPGMVRSSVKQQLQQPAAPPPLKEARASALYTPSLKHSMHLRQLGGSRRPLQLVKQERVTPPVSPLTHSGSMTTRFSLTDESSAEPSSFLSGIRMLSPELTSSFDREAIPLGEQSLLEIAEEIFSPHHQRADSPLFSPSVSTSHPGPKPRHPNLDSPLFSPSPAPSHPQHPNLDSVQLSPPAAGLLETQPPHPKSREMDSIEERLNAMKLNMAKEYSKSQEKEDSEVICDSTKHSSTENISERVPIKLEFKSPF